MYVIIFRLSDVSPDFALLASDGLWDTHSNEAASAFVKKEVLKSNKSEDAYLEAIKSLAIDAYRKESLDNITILAINLKEFNAAN